MSFTAIQFHKIILTTAIFILALSFPPFCFSSSSANLHVSATIFPRVNLRVNQHIMNYQVHNEDILKGYIDLPSSITVSLKTNTKSRIPLVIDNWEDGKVLVRESGAAGFTGNVFTVDTTGNRTNEPVNRNYDLRIMLPAEAREGIYPLNISVTAAI